MFPSPTALVTVALALVLTSCSASEDSGSVRVATGVYPLQYVAEEIGGDHVEVVNVTPPGAEPHDVELGPSQVIELVEADLVLYVGSDFQHAVEEGLDDAQGETLDALEVAGGPLADDPHFWLDPTRLAEVASAVTEELAQIDPENRDAFVSARDDLLERLDALDAEFETVLGSCRSNTIVTSHEAFGHLAERYDLVQNGISGLDPESEPSPQRIAEVADYVRANDVKTIFFETLLPPDAAETIARETGASTATLDPLESRPEEGDYISAMQRNLENLGEALRCNA